MSLLAISHAAIPYIEKRGRGFMENETEGTAGASTKRKWSDVLRSNTDAIIVTAIASVVSTAVVAVIGAIVINSILLPHQLKQVDEKISFKSEVTDVKLETINNSIAGLGRDIERIEEKIDAVDSKVNNEIIGANSTMTELVNSLLQLVPTSEAKRKISTDYNGRDNPASTKQEAIPASTPVAYSLTTGAEFTASQLAELPLLLPYKSGGQEVYFYGQFDEDGNWDGHCLLNTYENDRLVLITDANYDHGKLLDYRQVFFYNSYANHQVWAFSNRVYEGDFNSGETWLYRKNEDHVKDFTLENVQTDDLLTPETFWNMLDRQVYGYYHGNTSNGKFNDDTGDAYMVHFFEDGKVRLLYCGNFADGRFNDNTGNAWYIVKEPNTDYMYFRGKFRDSREIHTPGKDTFQNYLRTEEDLAPFLEGKTFDIELEWDLEII